MKLLNFARKAWLVIVALVAGYVGVCYFFSSTLAQAEFRLAFDALAAALSISPWLLSVGICGMAYFPVAVIDEIKKKAAGKTDPVPSSR
jgi:hypothetical protein